MAGFETEAELGDQRRPKGSGGSQQQDQGARRLPIAQASRNTR